MYNSSLLSCGCSDTFHYYLYFFYFFYCHINISSIFFCIC